MLGDGDRGMERLGRYGRCDENRARLGLRRRWLMVVSTCNPISCWSGELTAVTVTCDALVMPESTVDVENVMVVTSRIVVIVMVEVGAKIVDVIVG
jgi:hypothetical protein